MRTSCLYSLRGEMRSDERFPLNSGRELLPHERAVITNANLLIIPFIDSFRCINRVPIRSRGLLAR